MTTETTWLRELIAWAERRRPRIVIRDVPGDYWNGPYGEPPDLCDAILNCALPTGHDGLHERADGIRWRWHENINHLSLGPPEHGDSRPSEGLAYWLKWALDTLDAEAFGHYTEHKAKARAALGGQQ